jgi:c-di-GMP-binding flagellar brake protein YcgR
MFITVGGGRLYEKAIEIDCRDISGGGLSFETQREIPLDSKSKIIMGRLGNLPPSAIIEGRVVYRSKQADTDLFTVGVEFIDFVNTSREELLERIEDWQDEAPSRRR